MAKKELQVSAIENGTVIDHIPADKLFDVINVLGITGMDNAMTFGANLKSSKLGKKAIIKIWDKFLEDDEVNKLALVAPSAKINIIRDCITNHEKVRTKFTVVKDSPIVLKCHYCEKLTDQEHMEMN